MSIFSTSDGLSWTKGYSGSAKEKKRKKKLAHGGTACYWWCPGNLGLFCTLKGLFRGWLW
jgi:hypothetical protein